MQPRKIDPVTNKSKEPEIFSLEDGWQDKLLDTLDFDGGFFSEGNDEKIVPKKIVLDSDTEIYLPVTLEDFSEGDRVLLLERSSCENFFSGEVFFGEASIVDEDQVVFVFERKGEVIVSARKGSIADQLKYICKFPEVSLIEVGTILSRVGEKKNTRVYSEVRYFDDKSIYLKHIKPSYLNLSYGVYEYDGDLRKLEIFLQNWEIEE